MLPKQSAHSGDRCHCSCHLSLGREHQYERFATHPVNTGKAVRFRCLGLLSPAHLPHLDKHTIDRGPGPPGLGSQPGHIDAKLT